MRDISVLETMPGIVIVGEACMASEKVAVMVTNCEELIKLSLSEFINSTVGSSLYLIAKEAEAVLLIPARSSKVLVATVTSTKTSEEVGETVKE